MMPFQSPLLLLKFLIRQRLIGFSCPSEPCLDDEALSEFKRLLSNSDRYLEFGSGGSTVLAAALGKPTLSVECDRFFAESVRKRVEASRAIRFVDVSIGLTREWGFPVFTKPTEPRLRRWKEYVESPFSKIANREAFPDFVLIDGRFRRACALATSRYATKVQKHVTIMFDDYFDGRDHYHAVEKFLGKPEKVGRAAIFKVGHEKALKLPSESDYREAAQDFR